MAFRCIMTTPAGRKPMDLSDRIALFSPDAAPDGVPQLVGRIVALALQEGRAVSVEAAASGALTVAVAPPPAPPALPHAECEEAIIKVMEKAERALKGSAIASRCGKKYTGHFRECLGRLEADGTLTHDEEGYRLAGQRAEPPPPHAEAEEVTTLDGQILGVLRKAEKPLTPEAIARRAGQAVPVTSYFRSRLTRLRVRGVITRLPGGGWWMADRGAPPHDDELTEQQLAARIAEARSAKAAEMNGHTRP
jgi:hypothetical protein